MSAAERRALRLAEQARLDADKGPAARNREGQFHTPWPLAQAVVAAGLAALDPALPLRFLDPAFGLGAFYDALVEGADRPIDRAVGWEADPRLHAAARALWAGSPLQLHDADFTRAAPAAAGATLLVCNPPYVRHHHLPSEEKARLRALGEQVTGLSLSGLAGLHAHFLLLSLRCLAPGGVAVWLMPGELFDVGYGGPLRRLLAEEVELLRLHRADPRDLHFGDALVSSAVLVFRRRRPPAGHRVRFSQGGSLDAPQREGARAQAELGAGRWRLPAAGARRPGGPTLGDCFQIRRGIATGANPFFIRPPAQWAEVGVPPAFLQPVLPGPRYLPGMEVAVDTAGHATHPRLGALLRCDLSLAELDACSPALASLLRAAEPEVGAGYLCRKRRPWYRQEQRPPAPLLCTYMGRGRAGGVPFRFVLNPSDATATNSWLMLLPRAEVFGPAPIPAERLRPLWQALNAAQGPLWEAGRVYGGGLHKLEPGELARLPLPPL